MASTPNNIRKHGAIPTPVDVSAEALQDISRPGAPPRLHLSQSPGGITNTRLEPWIIDFHELCETLLRPPPVGVKDGTYYVRGPVREGGGTRADANIERVELIVLDGDSTRDPLIGTITEGAPEPLDVHVALIEQGIPHVLYSTHSDRLPGKGRRYRILSPAPIATKEELDACVHWMLNGLHTAGCNLADVPENHRLSQPWFFPRVPNKDSEYLCFAYEGGQGLDVQVAVDWYRNEATFAADQLKEVSEATAPREQSSVFAQFNAEHGLEWVLETLQSKGYKQVSESHINGEPSYRLLSPVSTSGNAGIMVFMGLDGVWRVHSHHNAREPLTKSGGGVSTNDAWDLFRIFEHTGDQQAAITAWNQQRNVLAESTDDPPIEDIEKVLPLDPAGFPNQRLTKSGTIILPATVANVRHLLQSYNIKARHNLIRKAVELIVPGLSGCPENVDNSTLTHSVSLATLHGMASTHVPNCIAAIADRNPYNPVTDYVTSQPWDGTDRLEDLYATLTLAGDFPRELMKTFFRRWLISAIAAAFKSSGFRSRGVLVLQGPQSIGKTAFFLSFVDDPILRERLIMIDHHMDAANTDSRVTAISHWIVEIGELDSSFKKDIARLKGFLTSNFDKMRRPYDRRDSEYPRRTVFCASVNSENFLVDDSGNTRFWTIPVTKVDFNHGINMQQLWAQVLTFFEAGEQWWLTPEEEQELEERNQGHRAVNAVRDTLEADLDFDRPESDWKLMTATEVLYAVGISNPGNPQARDCGNYLREVLGTPTKSKGKTRWRVPLKGHDFNL
jgi:virulence-associated protein E